MRAALISLFFLFPDFAMAADPAYTVKTLERLAIYPESRTVAQVVPDNESRIAAEVSARIDEIPVRLGQAVRKGDVLV